MCEAYPDFLILAPRKFAMGFLYGIVLSFASARGCSKVVKSCICILYQRIVRVQAHYNYSNRKCLPLRGLAYDPACVGCTIDPNRLLQANASVTLLLGITDDVFQLREKGRIVIGQ